MSASVPYRAKPHLRHRGLVEIQLQLFYELRKVSSVETDGVLGDAVDLHRAAAVDGFQNAWNQEDFLRNCRLKIHCRA